MVPVKVGGYTLCGNRPARAPSMLPATATHTHATTTIVVHVHAHAASPFSGGEKAGTLDASASLHSLPADRTPLVPACAHIQLKRGGVWEQDYPETAWVKRLVRNQSQHPLGRLVISSI